MVDLKDDMPEVGFRGIVRLYERSNGPKSKTESDVDPE